jgi:hypothetical protein
MGEISNMTVKELNLKIDALDEYSTLLYDMWDERKPLKYPLGNDIYAIIGGLLYEYMQELENKEVVE